MKIIAIMPARNEAWVIGLSIRAALRWCDEIIVLDHASVDETPVIIATAAAEFPGRVHVITEPSSEWAEMSHRQRLLDAARQLAASHVAIVDADEVLSGNLIGEIREALGRLRPGQLFQLPMRNMHRSIHQYRSDHSPFGHTITTLAFADSPELAWRDRNGYPHHQREPYGSRLGERYMPAQVDGGVMHLQFSSWRRLLAKHALYKASERIRFPHRSVAEIDRLYSLAPDERGLAVSKAKPSWWAPYADLTGFLDIDREPWQEAEARRLVAQHGRENFSGLNLFGVVE